MIHTKPLKCEALIFFKILLPTHFISKISFFLSRGFLRFKKRGLTHRLVQFSLIIAQNDQ